MTGLLLIAASLASGAEPTRDEEALRIARQLVLLAADARLTPVVRLEALRTLGRLDADARSAVPALIAIVAREKELPEVIEHAVQVLGQIGPPARGALPALARAYGRDIDIDLAVRRATARITAPPDSLDLQELMVELRAADPGRRLRAAKALAAKGPRAEEAVPDLLPLLRDADADVRRLAVAALQAIERGMRHHAAVAEAYGLDLGHPDEDVRLAAARKLARFGAAAMPAAEALQRAMGDPSDEVRRAASEALNKLGDLPPPLPAG